MGRLYVALFYIMGLPRHISSREANKFYNDNSVMVRDKTYANGFQAIRTQITTSATELNFPEKARWGVYIINTTASKTVWIGEDDSITAAGENVFPLITNESMFLELKKNSRIYAIVAADSANVYVGGIVRI